MAQPQFTEPFDFSSDLSDDANWDVFETSTRTVLADGDAALISGPDNNEGYECIYQSACDGVTQCVKIELKTLDGNDSSFGAVLRAADADGSGNLYIVFCRWSGSQWEFSVERNIGSAHAETIGTRIAIVTPDNGDWFGFAVTGTGNDTVFDFWDFGGSDPGDFDSWGGATQTQTANPGTPLDVGDYVGLHLYEATAGVHHEIGTWEGGDQGAPPAGNAGIMTTNTGFWGPIF